MDPKGNSVWAFESARDGIEHYQGGYRRAFNRGGTGGTSAWINFMEYQPSIVHLSVDSMRDLVEVNDDNKVFPQVLSSTSGGMAGLKCNESLADSLWIDGRKPKLS